MKALRDIMPILRAPVSDALVGASTYAARAFVPSLGLKPAARMTLAAAVLHSRTPAPGEPRERVCWATEDELAQATGSTTRTVRRAIRTLETAGLLVTHVVERGGELPNGTVTVGRRVVLTIGELPEGDVRGLRGAMVLAFDSKVLLKTSARAVLAMVLLHEGENGWCFPGVERMAAMTGLATRTVSATLHHLVQLGHVVTKRPQARFGEQAPSRILKATPRFGLVGLSNLSHSGQIASGNRTPLPPKETLKQTSEEALATHQLALPFTAESKAAAAVPRNLAVEEVVAAHATICRAPAGDGSIERINAVLGEGLSTSDLCMAFHGVMTVAWRRERLGRRSVDEVLRTKAQALSFVRRVDPKRAEALELRRPIAKTTPESEERARKTAEALARFRSMPRPTFAPKTA